MGRFLLGPLTAFLILCPVALPVLMKKVFIIEAAMPVMTQVAIVAQTYGADHRYATLAVAVTTILGMAFIPIYMLSLGGI
ncbi:MAG: AEC family transporter [Firmicutes bacterium]|nr:AEC family transporter [Bacillota bacterium]MDD3851416.1 AEC family transporter [Bacillota bacterium]MDD4707390.1 AEC family transporter [Bacillota bacterium]